MPSIDTSLVAREAASQLVKRDNWASENVGVMVVFCIVFVVAVGVFAVCLSKYLQKRKDRKPAP
ncbi:hypothetical protein DCS_05077 [Drechmeria coniospora]|uniref:Uncharacterized protein n=1 Tax=Drechmeria coniospora TaxID=98403 RepID=A0A151GLS8_DRECN|nr:hypothetical protein DCS_05077 [Drechmeria coniospora]KYK58064.1 hypothetical protein DCS_05077 [Drechmeria coniospora]